MPGKGANSGGAEARSQAATLDQEPLGDPVSTRQFSKGTIDNPGAWMSLYGDEIQANAKPDPEMVRRFQAGETNFTPALVVEDRNGNVRAADEFSARMIASAAAAGKNQKLNVLHLSDDPRQMAIGRQMQRAQQPEFGRLGQRANSLGNTGNLMQVYSDQITGGKSRASQRQIDQAARNIRRNGGRSWLPVAVRETGEDRYQVVGDATSLAIARRANVRPWIYVVSE